MSSKAASKTTTVTMDASPDATAAAALAREARIRAAAIEKAHQLHSTARAKAQWDEWISKVQGKLIEPAVSRSTMQRAAVMLRPTEYEEVIEERAASRLCANPPCNVHLELKPTEKQKKFHISLSQQRVYDVRQAQQFCGEECFMESEIYKRSLSDEPFYMRQLGGQSIAPQPQQPAAAPQQQQPPVKTEEKKENPNADKNVITQLFIVEKESSVSTKFPAASSETSTNSALAVEGYQPKTKKASDSSEQSTTDAKVEETPVQPSAIASTTNEASKATDPSTVAPSADFTAAASTTSHPAAAAATTVNPPVSNASTASTASPLQNVSSMKSSLPFFDASKPLSRSAIDSLSPEQRSEYHSQMAQHVHHADADQSNGAAVMVTAATPQSEEKKIRRRKALGSADATKANDASSTPSAMSSTSATAAAATRTNLHSPAAVAAAVSAAPVSSLLASEEDDPDDPIISPQEIKSSLSSVRNHSLPSFVAVLQCFMRWTTLHTGTYLRTGRAPAPPQPAASNRQRQTAFLTMLKQHWTPVTNRLAVSRNFVHELKELTDTFSFDDSIPALRAEQWHAISLILLKSVTLRAAIQEGEVPRDSFAMNSWDWIKHYSNLRTAGSATPTSPAISSMQAAVEATAKAIGFSIDQLNSVFEQWMMQSEQSYAVSSSSK